MGDIVIIYCCSSNIWFTLPMSAWLHVPILRINGRRSITARSSKIHPKLREHGVPSTTRSPTTPQGCNNVSHQCAPMASEWEALSVATNCMRPVDRFMHDSSVRDSFSRDSEKAIAFERQTAAQCTNDMHALQDETRSALIARLHDTGCRQCPWIKT